MIFIFYITIIFYNILCLNASETCPDNDIHITPGKPNKVTNNNKIIIF